LGGAGNPFTWVGRQSYFNDSETGLYLLGSGTRYYATDVDQFLSEDPIGFEAGDPNLRRIGANNPVIATDPTGLETADSVDVSIDGGSFRFKQGKQETLKNPVIDLGNCQLIEVLAFTANTGVQYAGKDKKFKDVIPDKQNIALIARSKSKEVIQRLSWLQFAQRTNELKKGEKLISPAFNRFRYAALKLDATDVFRGKFDEWFVDTATPTNPFGFKWIWQKGDYWYLAIIDSPQLYGIEKLQKESINFKTYLVLDSKKILYEVVWNLSQDRGADGKWGEQLYTISSSGPVEGVPKGFPVDIKAKDWHYGYVITKDGKTRVITVDRPAGFGE
jgi:RHS repeat-associated protein